MILFMMQAVKFNRNLKIKQFNQKINFLEVLYVFVLDIL